MLLLAASSEWIVAAAGVVGALVGATAGGLVEWALGVRQEKRDATAAARLVAGQISAAESQIAKAEETGEWWGFYGLPIDTWPESRSALAEALDADGFGVVGQAVAVLETLREKMAAAPRFREAVEVDGYVDIERKNLRPIREEMAKAWNALADLAGEKKVGEVIPRPQDSDGG